MEVQQLRYFITVIESGSLSRAAQSLRMSQPALSQQMRALENSLHTILLERSNRGIRPTASGQALYKDAFRLVREFDQLATSVAAATDVRGVVSVGVTTGVASHLAAPLVRWTLQNHPGIRLEVFESMSGYLRELFQNGRMDFAISYDDYTEDSEAGVEGQGMVEAGGSTTARDVSAAVASLVESGQDVTWIPLFEEEMFAFGPLCSAYAHNGIVRLEDIADLPMVAPGLRSNLRSLVDRAFRRRALNPKIVADLESLPTMLEIARSGSAFAILPLSADKAGTVPHFHVAGDALRRRAVLNISKSRATSPSALKTVLEGLLIVTQDAIEQGESTGYMPLSTGFELDQA